jgi:hypothetical protein
MKEQVSVDVVIDESFVEEVVKETGYECWLSVRFHEEICQAAIAVFLKKSKEIARLKRLDENVKRIINEKEKGLSVHSPEFIQDRSIIKLLKSLYDENTQES